MIKDVWLYDRAPEMLTLFSESQHNHPVFISLHKRLLEFRILDTRISVYKSLTDETVSIMEIDKAILSVTVCKEDATPLTWVAVAKGQLTQLRQS